MRTKNSIEKIMPARDGIGLETEIRKYRVEKDPDVIQLDFEGDVIELLNEEFEKSKKPGESMDEWRKRQDPGFFKKLISEGLAKAYDYKFINGDISDKKFKDILKFRVEGIVKGTRLSPNKTTNLLLKELPTITDDFENYLIELEDN